MSAKNWKDKVSKIGKTDKFANFSSSFAQRLTSLFDVTQSRVSDLVGVDIGPERIRLMRINTKSDPYQLVEYAATVTPHGTIVKDEIKDAQAIGNALKNMVREAKIASQHVAVAIPRTLAIIKNITVDKRFSADDIESRAWIEANRLFPDLVGNIYLDFTVTGPSTQPDQLDLLMVACRKEHIKPYLEVLDVAGLEPSIVDVNCYALERSLMLGMTDSDKKLTTALLNINMTQSSMIVVHKDQLIHAHDQTFDGQRLMKQVDDFVKARGQQEGMSEAPISVSDTAYRAIMQDAFLSHLRHTIHFFYSSRSNITIDKIILAGDCASIPDFSGFIQAELNIKTELAKPFENMSIGDRLNKEEIEHQAPALMLCCGLALSSVGE